MRQFRDIGLRNPLRDRYVIVYFNADGRFTRMFSNVAQIPPIYPKGRDPGSAWRGESRQ